MKKGLRVFSLMEGERSSCKEENLETADLSLRAFFLFNLTKAKEEVVFGQYPVFVCILC